MKGNVRERGNGRLDGNWASVKDTERKREQEGGVICLAQMESIFAPFHQSCARVWIKAGLVLWKGRKEPEEKNRLTSLQSTLDDAERATRDTISLKVFQLEIDFWETASTAPQYTSKRKTLLPRQWRGGSEVGVYGREGNKAVYGRSALMTISRGRWRDKHTRGRGQLSRGLIGWRNCWNNLVPIIQTKSNCCSFREATGPPTVYTHNHNKQHDSWYVSGGTYGTARACWGQKTQRE